ncbi:MAG: hypothetical protein GY940_41995 [bacterium]|nr:hypothetical protein [bacterium]
MRNLKCEVRSLKLFPAVSLVLMWVALLALPVTVYSHKGLADDITKRVSYDFDDGTLVVTANIQIYGFYGSQELADKWENWINEAWNAAAKEHSCIPMEFKVGVDYSGMTYWSVDDGYEAWYVHPDTADDPYRSNVSGYDVTAEDGYGNISLTGDRYTIAHEAGHLFGHPDMYSDNAQGYSIPFPSWGSNIMAHVQADFVMILAPQESFDSRNFDFLKEAAEKQMGQELPDCLNFRLTIDWTSDEPSHCNRDRLTGTLEFSVGPDSESSSGDSGGTDQTLSGSGSGSLEWKPVSRCPGTDYGGHRTLNNPFNVKVTGSLDSAGRYRLSVKPEDKTEAFFTNGQAYGKVSVLPIFFKDTTGFGAPGSLSDFTLPLNVKSGDRFPFRIMDSRTDGAWWEGEAILEVL